MPTGAAEFPKTLAGHTQKSEEGKKKMSLEYTNSPFTKNDLAVVEFECEITQR